MITSNEKSAQVHEYHEYKETVTKKATCTEDGVEYLL